MNIFTTENYFTTENSLHNRWLQPGRSVDAQVSELIVPSEGATCWENVTCTAQTRDHDGTRVYVPHMKVWCVTVCVIVCVTVYVTVCVTVCCHLHVILCVLLYVSLCVLLYVLLYVSSWYYYYVPLARLCSTWSMQDSMIYTCVFWHKLSSLSI